VNEADDLEDLWSRLHAVAMLAASCVALALGVTWPVALAALASVAALLVSHRGRYTPRGTFGPANAVTLLRLLLVAGLALVGPQIRGASAAQLVLAVFALDGIDGRLARRQQLASPFGARFDMECDGVLILVASLLAYLSGRLPPFILVSGTLRYVYVLALMWLPAHREAPRSALGRYAFALMVLSLCASLWPLEPWHRPFALLATLLLVYSFGRSVHWSLKAA
jgi:phosphatidylglycerophosphate synthase